MDFVSQHVDPEDRALLICHLLDRKEIREIRYREILENYPPTLFTIGRFGWCREPSHGRNTARENALSSANDRVRPANLCGQKPHL
jgi:hypothetical protein